MNLFSSKRCQIEGCVMRVPRAYFCCADDWALVPAWLKQRIKEARAYGRGYRCHPTAEYLESVQTAIKIVNEKRTCRHGRPNPPAQLDLLST